MKKLYFTILLVLTLCVSFAQNETVDLRTQLGKVSQNVNDGYASFNLEDLKYHAKKALQATKKVKTNLDIKKCQNTYDVTVKISDLLDSALISEELVEGQRYLNETKPLLTKAFYELEICTSVEYSNLALTNLEQQQSQLKQQQLDLERQAAEIKKELEAQKLRELNLKKQGYISNNENALQNTIKAYNESLNACNCRETITAAKDNSTLLINKTLEEIKAFYIDKMITITNLYQSKLNACKN